jgi:hypothetical protein
MFVSHLGGVMVSVLATGPKVCRFKPGQSERNVNVGVVIVRAGFCIFR